jgi:hypothetical protein
LFRSPPECAAISATAGRRLLPTFLRCRRKVGRGAGAQPRYNFIHLSKDEIEILRCQFGTFDFMFQLDKTEKNQLVTNCDRFATLKHSSSCPYAFTENGVAMLSSVLNSETAVMVNMQIMRAFVRIRNLVACVAGSIIPKTTLPSGKRYFVKLITISV